MESNDHSCPEERQEEENEYKPLKDWLGSFFLLITSLSVGNEATNCSKGFKSKGHIKPMMDAIYIIPYQCFSYIQLFSNKTF